MKDNGWRSKSFGVCDCCGLIGVNVDQNDCCEACDASALGETNDQGNASVTE